jgi:hypothetical protein
MINLGSIPRLGNRWLTYSFAMVLFFLIFSHAAVSYSSEVVLVFACGPLGLKIGSLVTLKLLAYPVLFTNVVRNFMSWFRAVCVKWLVERVLRLILPFATKHPFYIRPPGRFPRAKNRIWADNAFVHGKQICSTRPVTCRVFIHYRRFFGNKSELFAGLWRSLQFTYGTYSTIVVRLIDQSSSIDRSIEYDRRTHRRGISGETVRVV